MTVRLYKSTDASAPVLTGAVGSLVALLDAILVNGYGSKTAAGWSKAFTGTNKASYRMVTTGNTGFYLDVDDSGPGAHGAREARMRGYEAMTAVATGTNPFPTVAQSSFGAICRKSNTADATARPWFCIADGSVFYLFIETGDFANPTYTMAFSFGDFFSYKSGDTYNCAIIGRSQEASTNDFADCVGQLLSNLLSNTSTGTLAMHFLARSYTGTGGSQQFGKFSAIWATNGSSSTGNSRTPMGSSNAQMPYPNGPDQSLLMAPVFINQGGNVRGYMKGLWAPGHPQPLAHGDTFTGTGSMSAKSFIALNIMGDQSNQSSTVTKGQLFVETSDTWS